MKVSGGGGGSFIYDEEDDPKVIAAGGGGGCYSFGGGPAKDSSVAGSGGYTAPEIGHGGIAEHNTQGCDSIESRKYYRKTSPKCSRKFSDNNGN